MIYSLSGRVSAKREHYVVIEVNGVGFKVFMSPRDISAIPEEGKEAKIFNYLYLREDGLELYGFSNKEKLEFFELLISVSGVGPKSALSVLDVDTLSNLSSAIKEGRPDLLTAASGVGRKTAERIILELRNRVQAAHSEANVAKMESDVDVVEALVSLGYRKDQAKGAVSKVGTETRGLEARLKAALKILSTRK